MKKAEKLYPAFKDYIWGGKRLMKKYKGEDLPRIAEAWVVSSYGGSESKLADGEKLSEFLKKSGESGEYPVLIKILDAEKDLSIQVHPGDDYARKHENSPGKTEMWYIIDAEKGAGIYYGFKRETTKEEFKESIENGTLTELLRFVPVKSGEAYFIPAGTVHAIGKGLLIAEIQQNSNITYRVFDYGRTDDKGNPRPLHIQKALEVSSLTPVKEISGTDARSENGVLCSVLADCKYFKATHIKSEGLFKYAPKGGFAALLIIEGEGAIDGEPFEKFDSFLIHKSSEEIEIRGNFQGIITEV